MDASKKAMLVLITASMLTITAISWGVNERSTADDTLDRGQRVEKRWGQRHGGPMSHLARQLDLTEEQRAEIQQIMMDSRAENEALRSQLQDMRSELRTMVRETGYFEDQVRMLVESNAAAFVDLTVASVRTMSEIHAVLTPEQQAQAAELLDRGPGGFGWRGRMGF